MDQTDQTELRQEPSPRGKLVNDLPLEPGLHRIRPVDGSCFISELRPQKDGPAFYILVEPKRKTA